MTKLITVRQVERRLTMAIGERVTGVEVGIREVAEGETTVDARKWGADSDLYDTRDLTEKDIADAANSATGVVFDLYVYGLDGLITNACLAIASGGEVLYLGDSVSGFGFKFDQWICEVTEN